MLLGQSVSRLGTPIKPYPVNEAFQTQKHYSTIAMQVNLEAFPTIPMLTTFIDLT
jgi:hypothetical protein